MDDRFAARCRILVVAFVALAAQTQMPDPKAISGSILPVSDVPVGTVTVRVIRGDFDKNLPGQVVEFTIDGKVRRIKTDDSGRATVTDLRRGTTLTAVTVVGSERLVSQEAVIADTGLRIVLVATDPAAVAREAESKALASAPPVKGMVILGGESRVIVQFTNDKLQVFYLLDIVNSARTPVDIGGPLVFDLPRTARGAAVMEDSSKQATANGPHVTVTGPFAPGTTPVRIAYELPYSGPSVRLDQRWPAALQETTVIVSKVGDLDIASAQLSRKQAAEQQGQTFLFGTGPPIAAGESLRLDFSGLPHHARWPRYLALGLAGAILAVGVWAAVFASPRRPRV
jgi:hypothetical protein